LSVLALLVSLPSATAAGEEPAGGEPARQAGSIAVATIDGKPITLQEFLDEIAERSRNAPGAFSDPEQRTALLEEMVRLEVLVAAARREGYESDPEVVRALERLMVRRFEQDLVDPLLRELTVSDDEVARYYREHLADYTVPERVRVAMIFVEVPPGAGETEVAALAARAEEALAEARTSDGAAFAAAARRFSDDRISRHLGGNIGWISEGEVSSRWEPVLVAAAFRLDRPGQIGPVVRGERGFYVLKLLERKTGGAQPLDRVESTIRDRLLHEKKQKLERELYGQLREQVDVSIDSSLVESLDLSTTLSRITEERQPPALPGR
jgi:parvulin-like peptidyl-prolyl isomerase